MAINPLVSSVSILTKILTSLLFKTSLIVIMSWINRVKELNLNSRQVFYKASINGSDLNEKMHLIIATVFISSNSDP